MQWCTWRAARRGVRNANFGSGRTNFKNPMSQNEITNDRMNEEKTVSAVGVRWSRRPIVEVVVVELSFGNAQQTLKGGHHLGTHQELYSAFYLVPRTNAGGAASAIGISASHFKHALHHNRGNKKPQYSRTVCRLFQPFTMNGIFINVLLTARPGPNCSVVQ